MAAVLNSHSSNPPATDNVAITHQVVSEGPRLSREAACATRNQHDTDPVQNANMFKPPHGSEQPAAESISQPTFFQKYFTRPSTPSTDPEKSTREDQQFSFLSLGSLVSAAVMLLILLGVIAAALALTLDHSHHPRKPTDAGEYLSPIRLGIPSNFPDPALWYENGTWYAFATNNAAGVNNPPGQRWKAENYTKDFGKANVQLATSLNFINWTLVDLEKQPLAFTGNWTGTKPTNEEVLTYPKVSSTWAPAVIKNDQGKYVLYYTSASGGPNPYADWPAWHPQPHCIGVAISDTPWGPFEAQNISLACPVSQGGAIDPEAVRDIDGTVYLTYKIDGNNIGRGGQCGNMVKPIRPTPIMLQKMKSDGLTTDGDPIEILTNIKEDGPLIEAPMLIRSKGGTYFLFFSSGCTRFASYTTKYATATQITGPYTRHNETLLQTGDWGLEAPGSVGIAEDGEGSFNMAFHARVQYGEVGRVRAMFTTKLNFTGHEVTMMRTADNGSAVHLDHQS